MADKPCLGGFRKFRFVRLRDTYRFLIAGHPGQRFRALNERRRGQPRTPVGVAIGASLVLIGLFLSLPPGFPGFLLWLPGFGILAARSRPLARWLDQGELWLRKLVRATFGWARKP